MKKLIIILLPCIFDFTFLQAQNVLKVQPGAVIKTTGGALITLQNMNLDNDGTISQGAGEGKFLFTGTADNTISGTGTMLFDFLEIGKPGAAKISLLRNVQVGSGITFTSGLIDLNNNNIFMQPTCLLIGESEVSRITGISGGYIEITSTLNSPAAANPGNLGAIITSSQNMGSTTIRRGHQSQINGYGNGSTIFRYYDITPTNNTALNATLRLNYFDAELNSLNENTITLWKSTNNITWLNQGFDTRNTSVNYVEKTAIADFSRWTLTTPLNPLPLSWGSFHTQCLNNAVKISWQTFQESNTKSFTVQQTTDGTKWDDLTTLPAAGNSASTLYYTYTHPQSNGNINYYRIIVQDVDGRKTYSPVLKSICGTNTETISVYPVPANNHVWINIKTVTNQNISMHLYDSKGRLVKQQINKLQAGNNILELSVSNLASGIYSLRINYGNGKVEVRKIVKQ